MTSTRSLRSDATHYADEARTRAAQAMDTTREFAGEAMDRAGERMRDIGYGLRDYASRGASSMSQYTRATQRYVTEQPVKSALIAAAVGAAVAGLVIALRRNSDRRY